MHPLFIAAVIMFIEGLVFGFILPVLSPYAESLGGGTTWAGMLFAAAVLPKVFATPFWGWVSDRLGRRPVMAILALGGASASILWALSPSLDGTITTALIWLLISRLVYGVFAAFSVLGMAVASDVSTPEKRAASVGLLGAAFGLAIAVGPALGGIFANQFGHAAIGYLTASLQVISITLILFALRETRPNVPAPSQANVPVRTWIEMATEPMVTLLFFVTLIGTIAYAVLFPTFPTLVKMRYEWDVREVGMALSVFGFIGAIVQGGLIRPLVRRLGEKLVAILGLVMLGGGLAAIAFGSTETELWIALTITAIGTGLNVPTVTGLISLCVPRHEQGAVHGLNQCATSIGRAVGFAASGFFFEQYGANITYQYAAYAAVLAFILLLFVRKPDRSI